MLTQVDVDALFEKQPFEATEWVGGEFAGIDLGDSRLNERTRIIGEDFAKRPSARIPEACKTWMKVKAAYRYFDSKKVTPEKIITPHRKQTINRMRNHGVVLALQDTVFFSYNHKANGLGPIGKNNDHGMGIIFHHVFPVTTRGLPLGTLYQNIWTRKEVPDEEKIEKIRRLQETPVEEKEISRWILAALKTDQLAPGGVKVVTVCDREADFYEFIGNSLACNRPFVIRANHDRKIETEQNDSNFEMISQALMGVRIAGTYEVEVLGNSKRSARTATVVVRYTKITLREPYRSDAAESSFEKKSGTITAISVVEFSLPPEGEEPIHWVLLTNEAVANIEDAKEKIDWYCCRWLIEIYHKVLKTSCRVEDSLLRNSERLSRYIALKTVIAYRLMLLTYISRINPADLATSVLTDAEWKMLYAMSNETSTFPRKPPTVRQCVRWLSQHGGFLGRTRDGEPGIVTVARGWQRLCDFVTAVGVYRRCIDVMSNGIAV